MNNSFPIKFAKQSVRTQLFLSLLFTFFYCSNFHAQTYFGSATFGNSNQYSFDYSIECIPPGTTATLTVTFTTPPPPNIVPQLHLGGGVFVAMFGSGPYYYNFTGLTNCDFSFFFWLAYQNGGLYASSAPVTQSNTTLPITLAHFKVQQEGSNSAKLEWTTLSEINGDHFRIERSVDGEEWGFVGQVPSAGNSSSSISYDYIDANIADDRNLSSIYYYRLKLVDLDGTFEYSAIRSLRFDADPNDVVFVFPVPANDFIYVDMSGTKLKSGPAQILIFNASGKVVLEKEVTNNGIQYLNINRLTSGNYHLIVTQGSQKFYANTLIKVD